MAQSLNVSARLRRLLTRGYRNHGRARDLQAYVVRGNAQVQEVFAQGNDGAPQTAAGHHPVSCLKGGQHCLPFLLAPLLRQDQQKVKDDKNEDQGQPPQSAAAGLLLQRQHDHSHCACVHHLLIAALRRGGLLRCSVLTPGLRRDALETRLPWRRSSTLVLWSPWVLSARRVQHRSRPFKRTRKPVP